MAEKHKSNICQKHSKLQTISVALLKRTASLQQDLKWE